jgi:integrase
VKPISLHNLRHCFASQHLISGTPLLELSRLLGHANPSITLSVYSHWAESEKSNSQAKLAGRIFSADDREELEAAGAEGQKN